MKLRVTHWELMHDTPDRLYPRGRKGSCEIAPWSLFISFLVGHGTLLGHLRKIRMTSQWILKGPNNVSSPTRKRAENFFVSHPTSRLPFATTLFCLARWNSQVLNCRRRLENQECQMSIHFCATDTRKADREGSCSCWIRRLEENIVTGGGVVLR
jgi:hypothetical protein